MTSSTIKVMALRETVDFVWHSDMVILRHMSLRDTSLREGTSGAHPREMLTRRGERLPVIAKEGFSSAGIDFNTSFLGPVSLPSLPEFLANDAAEGEVDIAIPVTDVVEEVPFASFPSICLGPIQVVQTFWPGASVSPWTVTQSLSYSVDGESVYPLHTARMGGDKWLSAYAVFSSTEYIRVALAATNA